MAAPTTTPAAARRSTPSWRWAREDKLKFDKESYDTDAGCVEVTYTNDGSTAHNLLIEGVSDFKLNVGDVDTGTVELAAGNYEIYCDLAGHKAAGMVADLEPSAEAARRREQELPADEPDDGQEDERRRRSCSGACRRRAC